MSTKFVNPFTYAQNNEFHDTTNLIPPFSTLYIERVTDGICPEHHKKSLNICT